jgi:hypothetical protein
MEAENVFTRGPVITVHKDWLLPGKKKGKKTLKKPDAAPVIPKEPALRPLVPIQRFKFVNAVKPGRNRDADVRKLVRSHVRQDHALKAAQTRLRTGRTMAPGILNPKTPEIQSSPLVYGSFGLPTSLTMTTYPIEMQPQNHFLLDHYLRHTTTSTVHSVPAKLQLRPHAWFEFAVNDAAMLHGILYAGSLYRSLQYGEKESKDTVYHQTQVVLLVNKRLSETTPISDSTIGSITCLALGAVSQLFQLSYMHWLKFDVLGDNW